MARLIDARYKGYVGRDAALPTGAIAASLVPAQGSAAAGVPAHGDGRSLPAASLKAASSNQEMARPTA